MLGLKLALELELALALAEVEGVLEEGELEVLEGVGGEGVSEDAVGEGGRVVEEAVGAGEVLMVCKKGVMNFASIRMGAWA